MANQPSVRAYYTVHNGHLLLGRGAGPATLYVGDSSAEARVWWVEHGVTLDKMAGPPAHTTFYAGTTIELYRVGAEINGNRNVVFVDAEGMSPTGEEVPLTLLTRHILDFLVGQGELDFDQEAKPAAGANYPDLGVEQYRTQAALSGAAPLTVADFTGVWLHYTRGGQLKTVSGMLTHADIDALVELMRDRNVL